MPVALMTLLLASFAVPPAFAEDETPELSVTQLAEEFSDPLTTVPQIFMQDAYTPASYGTGFPINRVIARLIVPRLPKYSLFPFVQLIRPSFSLLTVPDGRGGTRTAFGDMQLLDLAVIPWPGNESGLMMAVGPVFVFPTATDRVAGQGAWQVGPAFGLIYKGLPGWLLGCVIQDPISFAYTSRDRPSVGFLSFQPIVFRHLWRGLYAKSGDATWVLDWRNHLTDGEPLHLDRMRLALVVERTFSPAEPDTGRHRSSAQLERGVRRLLFRERGRQGHAQRGDRHHSLRHGRCGRASP